jgi:hypothetical protein
MNLLSQRLEAVSSLIKEARKMPPALVKYIQGGARANNMSFLAYTRQLLKRRKAMRAQGVSWNKNTNAMEWGPGSTYDELGAMDQGALQRHALLDHSPFFRSKSRHAVLNELEDLGTRVGKHKPVPATTTPPGTPSAAPADAAIPVNTPALADDYRGIKSMVDANPSLTTGAQRKAMVQDLMGARDELARNNIHWSTEAGRPYAQVKDVRHYLNDADISELRTKLNIPENVNLNQLMYDLENLSKRKAYLASTRSSRVGTYAGIDRNARFAELAEPPAVTGGALDNAAPTNTSFAGFAAAHPILAAAGAGAGGSFIGYKFKDRANTSRIQQEYAALHGMQ